MSITENITPVVGMGATMRLPQDCYGYVIVGVSASGKTIQIQRLATVNKNTGHEPAYYEGPFPVWHHTYTAQEMDTMRLDEIETARLTKRGWQISASTVRVEVGKAIYRRNYSY